MSQDAGRAQWASTGRKSITERASFQRQIEELDERGVDDVADRNFLSQCLLLALLGHLSSCAAISGVIVSRRAALDLGPNVGVLQGVDPDLRLRLWHRPMRFR
jgi:hypothetical protein